MAAPNIYNLFRFLIGDSSSPYETIDLALLRYLDQALETLSRVSDFTFTENKVITTDDVNNGYFTLENEVIQLIKPFPLGSRGVWWEYGGGNKIRLLVTTFNPGTYSIKYRAKYKKFNGVMLSESEMNFPMEAEFAIVLYALGWYMQTKGVVQTSSGVIGAIKQKSEENMTVSYGLDGVTAEEMSSPAKIMERAINIMRNLTTAQDAYFSVKIV